MSAYSEYRVCANRIDLSGESGQLHPGTYVLSKVGEGWPILDSLEHLVSWQDVQVFSDKIELRPVITIDHDSPVFAWRTRKDVLFYCIEEQEGYYNEMEVSEDFQIEDHQESEPDGVVRWIEERDVIDFVIKPRE